MGVQSTDVLALERAGTLYKESVGTLDSRYVETDNGAQEMTGDLTVSGGDIFLKAVTSSKSPTLTVRNENDSQLMQIQYSRAGAEFRMRINNEFGAAVGDLLIYDGVNLSLGSKNVYHTGNIPDYLLKSGGTMTGNLAVLSDILITATDAADSPFLYMRDEASVIRAVCTWDRVTGSFRTEVNDATGAIIGDPLRYDGTHLTTGNKRFQHVPDVISGFLALPAAADWLADIRVTTGGVVYSDGTNWRLVRDDSVVA